MKKRTLEYYRALPYARTWEAREEEGTRYFVVRLVDIPQVVGGGLTKNEAVQALRDAFDDYVGWRLDEALPIPAPGWAFMRTSVSTRKIVVTPPRALPILAPSQEELVVETRSRAKSIVGQLAA